MYADTISEAMNEAITETNRRRKIQEKFNEEHNIIPKTIQKEIRDVVSNVEEVTRKEKTKYSKKEKETMIRNLEIEMRKAAANMDFERAMELRDIMFELSIEE